MKLVEMQQGVLPALHEGTGLIIQQCHDDQIQSYLLQLGFHMLQESHEEAAHRPQQAFHQQDECNPNLDLSSHSSLILSKLIQLLNSVIRDGVIPVIRSS
jgi:hypothetical protein